MRKEEITRAREVVNQIYVDDKGEDYIVDIRSGNA